MRTLRRPMFKIGGKSEVGNDGIMSGLVDREELQAGTIAPFNRFTADTPGSPYFDNQVNMDNLRRFQELGMGNPYRELSGKAGFDSTLDYMLRPAPNSIFKKVVESAPIVQKKEASEKALSTQEQLRPYQKYFSGNLEDVLKETKPKVEVEVPDNNKIEKKDDTGSNVVTQAEKNAILKARAEEFEELLNPGARKRVINNALAAASAQFGKSTGNTMQDIANAITAAAGATSEIDKTKQKAAELAIGESIQKGIAREKAATTRPNATQSLINFYREAGLDDKQIADKISKTSESELDYIRAYPVASQGKAAYVSNVEMKDNPIFGGVLSNDKKQRKEELKTLSPDKLYYDSSQDAYVKIVTGEDGKQTVQIVSKR